MKKFERYVFEVVLPICIKKIEIYHKHCIYFGRHFQGGMDSQLFTCCGSPAYAAPELVSGKEYLGSEVILTNF
jgi:hypothetical protein